MSAAPPRALPRSQFYGKPVVGQTRYSEKVAAQLMRQATQAVCHMHACGLVHRDVKPENLVLMSTELEAPLKLIDVSIAPL